VNHHDLMAQYPAIQAEALRRWRNGSQEPVILHNLPVALRLSADRRRVETSHGFNIPTRCVPLIVQSVRSGKLPPALPVGAYNATELTAAHFIADCQTIPLAEIEGIAKKLGL
jgi:hypothetical protein